MVKLVENQQRSTQLFFWEPVGAIPHCSGPSSLLGKWEDPKRRSKREELFESSVIQKRPFNVRTWGAEGRKCRWHRSKLLKQLSFRKGRKRKVSDSFLFLRKLQHRGEARGEGSWEPQSYNQTWWVHAFMRSVLLWRFAAWKHPLGY